MPQPHGIRQPAPLSQRQARLSNDGQWRSFPKVPNLLQYVGSGMYYARLKLAGKIVRRSLDTDVFSTAKLRLLDFTRQQRAPRASVAVPTFAEARQRYEQELDNDPGIKPQSRQYRRWCIRKLELSWPALESLRSELAKRAHWIREEAQV